MIVAMQDTATDEQIQQVVEHLIRMGFSVHRTTGERQTVLAAVGARVDFDTRNLEVLSGVEHVHRISAPYKLAGRSFRPQGTIIELAHGVQIGGDQVVVMAGPARWNRARSSSPWPNRWQRPGLACCAAALSNRAVRLIRFREWAKKDSSCCARPAISSTCW